MLTLTDLSLRIAGRLLIDHADLALPDGAKAGLVGRNGAGKTTLFRAITGDIAPETGRIGVPRQARIGQVAQEAPASQERLIDIVLAADGERAALLAEEAEAEDPHRIAEIHARLADIAAHSAEARAAAILAGLGFDHDAQRRPAASFSGGWRMRVALAAVLFAEPDLLLLDEPTNYLDLEGVLWLQDYLRRYPHTVLLISHDRDLLNTAVSTIVHLDERKLAIYRGGYDQFERQRAERAQAQIRSREKQEAARRHMEAFVARFRAKASKARQAQSRLKMLEKMAPIDAMIETETMPIRFTPADKAVASPIIALSAVEAGYAAGRPVLRRLDLRIDHDDRIALLGANGNGKSTFAKLVSGRLDPLSGSVTRGARPEDRLFRPAPARRIAARRDAGRPCPAPVAAGAGGRGAGKGGADGAVDREDGDGGARPVGRREGAAADGAGHLRRGPSADPRRADQPSRHRQPRRPDRSAQRFSRCRHPDRP